MKFFSLASCFILFSTLAFGQTDPLEVARKKITTKDFAGAKADLTKVIEKNPKNKDAFTLRGRARMGLQDFYGAIGDLNFALDIDSTFAEALNFRGESKVNLGDDSGAIADLQLFYNVGLRLCSAEKFPEWKSSSEFKDIREKSLQGK